MKTTAYLMLINRESAPVEHGRGERARLLPVGGTNVLLERQAAYALERLMEQIDGWRAIVPVSGWRSKEEQEQIWADSLRENGMEFTETYVALPGHSEHESGLAIDLGLKKDVVDFIRPDFPYDGICGTFRALAPDYGFIERYPEGKEEVTGIGHEPWHFRYIGTPHARLLTETGLVLEEYVAALPWNREPALAYQGRCGA
ncbi:M15 family metallopeptidase [Lachnospiraceae bacterium 47-T17]